MGDDRFHKFTVIDNKIDNLRDELVKVLCDKRRINGDDQQRISLERQERIIRDQIEHYHKIQERNGLK